MTDAVVKTDGDNQETEFSWGRVVGLFAPHRRRVLGVVGLVLVGSAGGVVNALLLRVMFDDGLFPADGSGVQLATVVTMAAIMLAVTAVTTSLGVVQTVVTNRLGQDVLRDLRDRLYAHLQGLSLSFFASSRTGDLQSRISSDVGGVQTAVTNTLSNMLSNTVVFIGALVAMVVLSLPLTLLSMLLVPLFVVAARWVGKRRAAFVRQTQEATSAMTVVTQEALSVSGITLSKLFGRQDHEIQRFTEANERLAEVAVKQQVIGQSFFTVIQAFLGASPILVYLVAGVVLNGGDSSITAGTVVAFTTLQTRLFFPVARLLETGVELQSSRSLFERIFQYLDDVDLRDLELASLAQSLGFVTQESYLFAGTIFDNIAYGRPGATEAEVEKASRAAAIHDRIMEFEDGYQTVVGERGFRLSGGERQRVAIARVLLHDPKVLVLDEATSALDAASERRIQSALDELVSGRTTLAVAHRLSTVQAADTIHVVESGRIVESGNHDELLAVGGSYAGLYREQFGGGTIEAVCSDGTVFSDGRCEYFAASSMN